MLSIGDFFFAAFVMNPRRSELAGEVAGNPGRSCSASQDAGDVSWIVPMLGHLPAQIEAAKERPRGSDRLEPALEGHDGAKLRLRPGRRRPDTDSLSGVVLGRRDPHVEPRRRELEVLDVERDELATPKRSGVAKQPESPIAQRREPLLRHREQERREPLDQQNPSSALPVARLRA
jgi:hypothetical protein